MAGFDFTVRAQYGDENFKKALVTGPGELREVVWRDIAPPPDINATPPAFMAVLMGLSSDGDVTSSQWVGGGSLEPPGAVKVEMAKLFPAVSKNFSFSLNVDLAAFEWPRDGGFLSGYREVPRDIPITVYKKTDVGDLVVDWDTAKEEGCVEFAVRAMVVHCSPTEVLVQVGCVPFDIAHMLNNYPLVYQEAFFPNTLLRVANLATRLPPGMSSQTTKLAKRVALQEVDGGGYGLGVLPFFTSTNLLPDGGFPMLNRPDLPAIQRALGAFMAKARTPVAKTAAHLPAALALALQGDKLPANILPEVASSWSVLTAPREQPRDDGGKA